jgi:hypothetical protein
MPKTVVRGNRVTITVTFRDYDGSVLVVSAANLTLSYDKLGRTHKDTVALVAGANNSWSYEFDTANCGSGEVFWSARAVDPTAAEDGCFVVRANQANPSPTMASTLNDGDILNG